MKASSTFLATLILGSCSLLHAQGVNTVPVGSVTVEVAAGLPAGRTISVISFPLNGAATASGQMIGSLTGVTANTLTNAAAAWSPGELSAVATPHIIRITSGTAKGRSFLVSTSAANTATTITIDSEEAALVNLTTIGLAAGDKYELLVCDTLSSILGSPATTGVQGGAAADQADMVQIQVQGQYRQYYYNTTRAAWVRIGPELVSSNVPLRPDSAIVYSRLGQSPLTFIITGRVPSTDRKSLVRNSGPTLLANGWPVNMTLATSGISEISGWVKSTSPGTADTVQVNIGGSWRIYYHDGTQWRRVGPNTPSNDVVLGVAEGILIGKQGALPGAGTISQLTPYNL